MRSTTTTFASPSTVSHSEFATGINRITSLNEQGTIET
jgi:hypothetical protein